MSGAAGPPYEVEFEIQEDDFVGSMRLIQRTLNTLGVISGSLAIASGLLLTVFDMAVIGLLVVGFGIFSLVAAATPFFDKLRARRAARSVIGTTAKFTIGQAGVDFVTTMGSGTIPWSAVTRLLESDDTVVLKRDRLFVAWIPKRAMGIGEAREELLAFIRARVGAPSPS